jgi:hypothetical protein
VTGNPHALRVDPSAEVIEPAPLRVMVSDMAGRIHQDHRSAAGADHHAA